MADYIPRGKNEAAAWADNFARGVEAGPGRYGLVLADAVAIRGVVDGYLAALRLANDPGTRTVSRVAGKDEARGVMEGVVRRYAQMIKLHAGVSDRERVALGLTVEDAVRTLVGAPVTRPECWIMGVDRLRHTLRFRDEGTATRRAKPRGVIGMELRYYIGEAWPRVHPDGGLSVVTFGMVTRWPVVVELDAGDAGKTATYWGRWVTRRGLVGPWSEGVGMMVAG